MNCTTKYAGLDVHQATTSISVRQETGRVIARTVLSTDAAALVEYFRGMRGTVHVAFEEGTQAQWLHDLLEPHVHRMVVCDQRRQRRHGNKADKLDADRLSDLLRRGGLRAVYHGDGQSSTLKEVARTYLNVVEDGTRTMLRLKALFRARGIPAPGRDVYDAKKRTKWLGKLEGGVHFRAEALYSQLDVLRMLTPESQGGSDSGSAPQSGFPAVVRYSVHRTCAGRSIAGHHADAVALPNQTKSLGLCRTRGGDALELRLRDG